MATYEDLVQQFNQDFQDALLVMLWDEVIFQLKCRVDEENRRWFSGDTRFSKLLESTLKADHHTPEQLEELLGRLVTLDASNKFDKKNKYVQLKQDVAVLCAASCISSSDEKLSDCRIVDRVSTSNVHFSSLNERRNMFIKTAMKKRKAYGLEAQPGSSAEKLLSQEASVVQPLTLKETIKQGIASLYGCELNATKDDLLKKVFKQSGSWSLWFGLLWASREYNTVKKLLTDSEKPVINNQTVDKLQGSMRKLCQFRKHSESHEQIIVMRQEVFNRLDTTLNAFAKTSEKHGEIIAQKNKAEEARCVEKANAERVANERRAVLNKAYCERKTKKEKKQKLELERFETEKNRNYQAEAMAERACVEKLALEENQGKIKEKQSEAQNSFRSNGYIFLEHAGFLIKGDLHKSHMCKAWDDLSQYYFEKYPQVDESMRLLSALAEWFGLYFKKDLEKAGLGELAVALCKPEPKQTEVYLDRKNSSKNAQNFIDKILYMIAVPDEKGAIKIPVRGGAIHISTGKKIENKSVAGSPTSVGDARYLESAPLLSDAGHSTTFSTAQACSQNPRSAAKVIRFR